MNTIFRVASLSLLCLGTTVGLGCGGSGGDGDFVGAAELGSIVVSPNRIDVADRAEVTVRFDDVNEDGVFLKLRFPDGLEYEPNTSFLEVEGDEMDIGPQVNSTDGSDVYLVYILDGDVFDSDESREGILTLQLTGVDQVTNGEVEVDLDVNDPQIVDASEFSVDDPQFQPEGSDDIEVEN